MPAPIELTQFAGQNWVITPAALAAGENPPASIHDQKFLLVLSGVVMANLEGNSTSQWRQETVSFLPDMAGPQNSGPLNWAIGRFGIPKPPGNFAVGFSLEEWAPFASLSSIYDQHQAIDAGFAVDVWRPTHFAQGVDAFTLLPVNNIFSGLNVDVAVRDTDAWLYRLGYNITLLGKIAFLAQQTPLFESSFDLTADGQPPSPTQAVGTAVIDPPAMPPPHVSQVVVVDPPFPHTNKWVQITAASKAQDPQPSFTGVLTSVQGDGTYCFSAAIVMPSDSNPLDSASISFESAPLGPGLPFQTFLHLDFLPDNRVRIDDMVEFGRFARDQVFQIQVILTVSGLQSRALISLSGGASGQTNYKLPLQPLSLQFAAIKLWKGSLNAGRVMATDILVTRVG
jgi:hypothetical protein